MSNHPLDQDQKNVKALADRAGELIDRRTLASTGLKLALPALATYMVSREAMAMAGSGGMIKK